MGLVEKEAKQKRTKAYIQRAILSSVASAGIIAVALAAPKALELIPRLSGNPYRFRYKAKTAVGRLAQKGLIRFVERDGKRFMEMTEKGRRVMALELAKAEQRKHRRWDKRYRLVMFDIPQKRRKTRDQLRLLMREYGFFRIQDSVWIFPYECEELVALLKADLQIGKDVIYAVVESIENDRWIKEHFGLN